MNRTTTSLKFVHALFFHYDGLILCLGSACEEYVVHGLFHVLVHSRRRNVAHDTRSLHAGLLFRGRRNTSISDGPRLHESSKSIRSASEEITRMFCLTGTEQSITPGDSSTVGSNTIDVPSVEIEIEGVGFRKERNVYEGERRSMKPIVQSAFFL